MQAEEQRARAFENLSRATELPMLVLAVALIPLLTVPLLLDLSASAERVLLAVDWFIWAVFALELVAKTYLAPQRLRYLRGHWFDVVLVVVPFLRPLRVARSARALRFLRLARVAAAGGRAVHSTRAVLDANGLKYVLLLGGLLTLGSAVLVVALERGNGGTIADLDDGIWWAMTTVTTVGYGDKFPVTTEGRALAVFLMVAGITLFSILTANIAAFLVKPTTDAPTLQDVMDSLRRLEERLAQLEVTDEHGP
jgi:voltage-gated potassium channel